MDQSVSAFVDVARRYCAFIEQAASFPLRERLRTAAVLLAKLVAAGLELPVIEHPPHAGIQIPELPETPWPGFDEFGEYWVVFDPYLNEAPVGALLTDDLLDIYFDLGRGLLHYRDHDPVAVARAVVTWKLAFSHWGRHATGALHALQQAIVTCEQRE
jgi:hypothetical protein